LTLLFPSTLLALLLSLPGFRLSLFLPPLGLSLAFALALTLSLSPLALAGGLFPLAALLISALRALLRPALVLTLLRAAVLCLTSTFLPASSPTGTR